MRYISQCQSTITAKIHHTVNTKNNDMNQNNVENIKLAVYSSFKLLYTLY